MNVVGLSGNNETQYFAVSSLRFAPEFSVNRSLDVFGVDVFIGPAAISPPPPIVFESNVVTFVAVVDDSFFFELECGFFVGVDDDDIMGVVSAAAKLVFTVVARFRCNGVEFFFDKTNVSSDLEGGSLFICSTDSPANNKIEFFFGFLKNEK